MMIPHEEIRDKKDRSWTFKLLDLITNSAPEQDLNDVCETLGALDDPRAVRHLLQLVQDTTQRYHLRKAASDALPRMCVACVEADRRAWWNSGDWLLQRLAIVEARTSEADILIPIARDPHHMFHCEAIRSLEFGFEEPDYQWFSIRAMSHPDPDVRKAAAKNFLWNEPTEAEDSLIAALWDSSDCVAKDSASTLVWYKSQKAFFGFVELSRSGPDDRREGASQDKEYFLDEVRNALDRMEGGEKEHFLNWLKPMEAFLSKDEEDEEESDAKQQPVPQTPPGVEKKTLLSAASEIIEFYDDADGCWHNKEYGQVDWMAVNEPDRKALADYLVRHPDHTVREIACAPLGLWDRGDLLEEFLNDPCGGVRKSAGYFLRQVTPDPAIAESLWNALANVNCTSTCAREALESYVVHAPRSGLADRLADIALSDKRISRAEAAIHELEKLGAHSQMHAVLSLLMRPPLINWEIHRQLVSYCVGQKIQIPNFLDLCQVDDVSLQEELAGAITYRRKTRTGGVLIAAGR